MKNVVIAKNSVMKIQKLIMNHKSSPIKLNPPYVDDTTLYSKCDQASDLWQ